MRTFCEVQRGSYLSQLSIKEEIIQRVLMGKPVWSWRQGMPLWSSVPPQSFIGEIDDWLWVSLLCATLRTIARACGSKGCHQSRQFKRRGVETCLSNYTLLKAVRYSSWGFHSDQEPKNVKLDKEWNWEAAIHDIWIVAQSPYFFKLCGLDNFSFFHDLCVFLPDATMYLIWESPLGRLIQTGVAALYQAPSFFCKYFSELFVFQKGTVCFSEELPQ